MNNGLGFVFFVLGPLFGLWPVGCVIGLLIVALRHATGAGPASIPAIVVIQEVYGVEEHIEDITQRFAIAGYEAIAPDLWAVGGARPEAITRERVAAVRAFLAANPAAWSGAKAREEALARLDSTERDRLTATMSRLLGSDEGRAERFARYAARTAWARTLSFFVKHLA
jgi:hypothetical protein